jgi:hypothetical protein
MELWLDQGHPDQVVEVEYELRDDDGLAWATDLSLTVLGENRLPPGDAVLRLYEVPADLEVDRLPPTRPIAEIPIGGQAAGDVWLVDESVWARISLPVGHHTKRLRVRLDGSADLELEGELLLRVAYTVCPRVLGGCDEPTVRILQVW